MNTTARGTRDLSVQTPAPTGRSDTVHRTALQVAAGLLALSAWYGALGLASGWLSIGEELTDRLPFGSAVIGGLALAAAVALPASVLTVLARRGPEATVRSATFAVGTITVVWILVELAFVRELSFLHPTVLLYGAALMFWSRTRSWGTGPTRR